MKYKIIRPPLTARFHLPSKEELFKVASGDSIKLMFQVSDDIVERMWVTLEECFGEDEWTGRLDNDPIGDKNARVLKPGMKVRFHPYDIIDIAPQGSFEQAALREEIAAGVKAAIKKRWWESTPVQLLALVGSVLGIVGFILIF